MVLPDALVLIPVLSAGSLELCISGVPSSCQLSLKYLEINSINQPLPPALSLEKTGMWTVMQPVFFLLPGGPVLMLCPRPHGALPLTAARQTARPACGRPHAMVALGALSRLSQSSTSYRPPATAPALKWAASAPDGSQDKTPPSKEQSEREKSVCGARVAKPAAPSPCFSQPQPPWKTLPRARKKAAALGLLSDSGKEGEPQLPQ